MKAICKDLVVFILTVEAKLVLKRAKPKVVAITGNVGKTSTKDAVYAAIKDHLHARKNEKSYNTELSVPLTVLGLRSGGGNPLQWLKILIDGFVAVLHAKNYPKVLVMEFGVDQPGDMTRLTSWIKPDIAVITRLPDVPVHVEQFSSPQAVADEKLKLLDALKPDGVFIYNNDDERVRDAAEEIRQQSIGYSRYSESHFTASGDVVVYDGGRPVGMEFDLKHLDTEAKLRVNGSIGVQHTYNYAAAVAVASQFDVSIEDAMKGLTTLSLPPGRMKLLRGIKDTLIIDDTYNSSPTAAERSLQALKELKSVGRKVAILGDMLELGQYSVREHERLGEQVSESADVLITIGIRSRKIAEGALEFGMSEKHIYQYDTLKRARTEVMNLLEKGDVVLVKGSQSMRLEALVGDIMYDTDQQEALLVRQSPEWLERPIQTLV